MVENQSWNRLIFPKWLQPLHIASKKTCVFAFYEKCIKKWNDFPMFLWQFSNMFWAMCDLTLQKPSLKWWFFQSKHFCHFFKCFSTVREHEFLLWTMTLCVDRGKTLQKNHQKCWFLNEVQFFQGFHRVKSFDFSKNTDFASWWFSVGFLYHFWRCVLAFWIDIKIL